MNHINMSSCPATRAFAHSLVVLQKIDAHVHIQFWAVAVAEQLGVTAEPEVATWTLSGDKTPLLVIASDGVFEFLRNEEVIKLVSLIACCSKARCILRGAGHLELTSCLQASKYDDPQESAIALVAEAYRLWLEVETRTDDITAIVIRIEELDRNGVCLVEQMLKCINCV